ncbi:hypothetical protein K402DRAFT_247276 [Aulographum hederae CBS 113979]|uniref:Uncharacterized protein n=1 Tax=Aulographum hederae CBS 113979 TaxID=1176131 RepID=A0A6G1HAI3_9PEZI|nr:hypothetical protein K402DRAFT_247276 [Aulographum hederae CBS 113979]
MGRAGLVVDAPNKAPPTTRSLSVNADQQQLQRPVLSSVSASRRARYRCVAVRSSRGGGRVGSSWGLLDCDKGTRGCELLGGRSPGGSQGRETEERERYSPLFWSQRRMDRGFVGGCDGADCSQSCSLVGSGLRRVLELERRGEERRGEERRRRRRRKCRGRPGQGRRVRAGLGRETVETTREHQA